eukprot:1842082-Rhodomonas_salina.1
MTFLRMGVPAEQLRLVGHWSAVHPEIQQKKLGVVLRCAYALEKYHSSRASHGGRASEYIILNLYWRCGTRCPSQLVDHIDHDAQVRKQRRADNKPLRLLIPVGGAGAQKKFVTGFLVSECGLPTHIRIAVPAGYDGTGTDGAGTEGGYAGTQAGYDDGTQAGYMVLRRAVLVSTEAGNEGTCELAPRRGMR